jgi:hydroxymethylpyrimidine pyrophosphatase-like HAD family hydrolase/DNA-binding response OmpR family regulator
MSTGESTERPRGAVLRALIVDDAPDDAELMAACLEGEGWRVDFERVESEEAMADALQRGGWDVVLCDHAMPTFSSGRALALLARVQSSLPTIVVSGAIGEEAAVALIRAGAVDFVSKDHLSLLPAAVRRALDEAAGEAELVRVAGELRDAEQRVHAVLASAGADVLDRWTRLNLIHRVGVLYPRSIRTNPTEGDGNDTKPMTRTDHSRGAKTTVDPGGKTAADRRDPQALRGELEQARRELEQARETLRAIRAGGFGALVIDTGRGDELFTLSGTERADRLVEVMADGTPRYFRAVALDYDGTLAEGEVAADALAAIAEARARGIRVILVTGRIISELRGVFAGFEDRVDAVVAENGAVLVTPVGVRRLAAPVHRAVSAALSARGVVHRSGMVLVACVAADESVALEVVRGLGLDCQLVRNRGELMILPAGVTKGSGLREALGDLGLSHHNTIGVGDGENDHSLLDVCEIGVAVANAVDAIRAHADVTLALPDGQGVTDLLRGPLLSGHAHVYPRRWQITLGLDDRGAPVTLPASQLNVAVCGASGEGKSYLAGLICEQLVRLGYSLVVFDPEGDHLGLGELRGVLVTGGDEHRLADPAEVVRLLRHGDASVVVDLSHLDAAEQAGYIAGLPGEIEAQRAVSGLPQWVVVDEAHGSFGRAGTALGVFNPAAKGYLLVTWQPEELSGAVSAALDAVIALGSPNPSDHLVDLTAAVAGVPSAQIARLLAEPTGRAVLAWRAHPHQAVAFTPGPRSTPHLRHEHKYDHAGVEPAHRFYFRNQGDTPTGAIAANLPELEAELVRCDRGVLRHHCPGHDFSHWIAAVFHDQLLAAELAAAEAQLSDDSPAAIVEQQRLALIAALQARHARRQRDRPAAG